MSTKRAQAKSKLDERVKRLPTAMYQEVTPGLSSVSLMNRLKKLKTYERLDDERTRTARARAKAEKGSFVLTAPAKLKAKPKIKRKVNNP